MNRIISYRIISYKKTAVMACLACHALFQVIPATADDHVSDNDDTNVVNVSRVLFKKSNSHQYGFDDFTGWSGGASDYYSNNRKGYCTNPHASFPVSRNDNENWIGYATMELTPSPVTSPVVVSCEGPALPFSPSSTTSTCTVSFGRKTAQTITNLNASSNSKHMARMEVRCYNTVEKNVRIVRVNGAPVTPDFSCFEDQAMLKINATACTYNITSLTVNGQTVPINDSTNWYISTLDALRAEYLSSHNVNCNVYLIFIIDGILLDNGITGCTSNDRKVSWVLSSMAGTRIPAHELGHCLGLEHRNGDKDALMCQTGYSSGDSARKLRINEWDKVREVPQNGQ